MTINDVDAAQAARDVLLFRIVNDIDANDVKDVEFLWDVWYNRILSIPHFERLLTTLHRLTNENHRLVDRQDFWTYGNEKTKKLIYSVLGSWLKGGSWMHVPAFSPLPVEPMLLLYRDSAEFLSPAVNEKYFMEWMKFGESSCARDPEATQNVPMTINPTMLRPDESKICVANDVLPWFSYFPMDR